MKIFPMSVRFLLVTVFLAMMSCDNINQDKQANVADNQTETGVLAIARQVVAALTAQDAKKLASLVHPEKGVRFSPSAYVDVASDVVFSAAQVEGFWSDQKTYTWGLADGTGEPISLTPGQYCREYIMNRDFLNPSSVNVNSDRATGNTSNNAATVYPNGTRVEFYIEPSMRNGVQDLDWAALRLVLERSGDNWFVVAIIHDQWTI